LPVEPTFLANQCGTCKPGDDLCVWVRRDRNPEIYSEDIAPVAMISRDISSEPFGAKF